MTSLVTEAGLLTVVRAGPADYGVVIAIFCEAADWLSTRGNSQWKRWHMTPRAQRALDPDLSRSDANVCDFPRIDAGLRHPRTVSLSNGDKLFRKRRRCMPEDDAHLASR